MRSPICNLENSIAGVAFNIAPEKETQCRYYRDIYGISIVLIDDADFSIRVNISTKAIILPIASLEYLWSFSLYSWILTQEYNSTQKDGEEEFDCLGNDRLRAAHKLLEWAGDNLNTTGKKKWPSGLPKPEKEPVGESDIDVANELFLCALGWMVHHEIGHIVLGHPPLETSLSEQEEKDADIHATNWLLSELESSSPMLKKRAIGISVAVLCLQSLEVGTKSCLRNTHPNAHDRVDYCLSKYTVGNEEVIEAFCAVILQYLFQSEGFQADISGETFSSIMGGLLFDMSRSKNS
jgi:hypothetical protein